MAELLEQVACPTCGGDGFTVGDRADARGERQDVIEPCPTCTDDSFDDRDPEAVSARLDLQRETLHDRRELSYWTSAAGDLS